MSPNPVPTSRVSMEVSGIKTQAIGRCTGWHGDPIAASGRSAPGDQSTVTDPWAASGPES
jgi:hypothetical protein